MNRVIKFRYVIKHEWVKFVTRPYTLEEIQDMCFPDDIWETLEGGCDGNASCQVNGVCECTPQYESAEIIGIEQFTGLLDVNGHEIFENDILGYQSSPAYTVVFERGSWMIKYFSDGNGDLLMLMGKNHFMKIIGNIHENPELLEGK